MKKITLSAVLLAVMLSVAAFQAQAGGHSDRDGYSGMKHENRGHHGGKHKGHKGKHKRPWHDVASDDEACVDMEGRAKGLCNAYCGAMECDSDSPNANERACNKISKRFERVTGEPLACSSTPSCACVEQLPDFAETVDQAFQCVSGETGIGYGIAAVGSSQVAAVAVINGNESQCGFYLNTITGLSEEEGQACVDYIQNKTDELGLICETVN